MPFVYDSEPQQAAPKRFVYDDARATQPPSGSNLEVFKNALYKGAAAVPDALLNTPTNVLNIGRMAKGAATGKPEFSDVQPPPDIIRGALEKIGLISGVQPQGTGQRTLDVLTQGATGGALTGGASIPRTIAGAGMGALSTGAAAGTEAATHSPTAGMIAGMLAPQGASKVFGGGRVNRPDVELLNREGVSMTPGQILGGFAQRAEDALTSVPLLGDLIKSAQRKGHETLGQAALNRSLAPIGRELPPRTSGNDAVAIARGLLGDSYDSVLGRAKVGLDGPTPQGATPALPSPTGAQPTLRQELDKLRLMAQNLPQAQRDQFSRILDAEIFERFPQNQAGGRAGVIPGDSIKAAESNLGIAAKQLAASPDYDNRTMSGAVKEAQAALRRAVARENPDIADELAATNEGWANFKRPQRAAASVAAPHGVFNPAQLHGAVKALDPSKDKAQFAQGDALMQDLSAAGKNVLSPTVPDSGTPYRSLLGIAGLGGLEHFVSPTGAAILGSTAIPYLPGVRQGVQKLLTMPENKAITGAADRSVVPLAGEEEEAHPVPGAVHNGFRFKGGDPRNPASWEVVR